MSTEKIVELDSLKLVLNHWESFNQVDLAIEGEAGGCYCCSAENIDIDITPEKAKEVIKLLEEYLEENEKLTP